MKNILLEYILIKTTQRLTFDIIFQTERIWLLGGQPHERSRTMVLSSNEKRDKAYENFKLALNEWAQFNAGIAIDKTKDYLTF